jgi:hypothetical protein
MSHANRFAVSTAAAVSLLAVDASAQNPAQTGDATEPPAVLQAQAERTVAFDIPSQPLAQALTAFGRQSGVQVAFDPTAAAGKTSAAVSGSMTPGQALRQLLGGSGLAHQFTSPQAVTVSGIAGGSGAVQLDPVRVQSALPPKQAELNNRPPAGPTAWCSTTA